VKRGASMNSMFSAVTLSLGVGVLGAAFAAQANAGCADFQPVKKAVSWQTPASYFGGLSFVRASDSGDSWHRDDVVGMWRFTMTVPGPNGSTIVIDDGYSQWHEDGTEIMNSGAHAPNTSNFCLGVWAETGPGAYKLNHFPLPWDASGTAPQGPIHIVANVKMKDHDHFSGPFTLNVYLWDGNEIVNASGAPIATVTGTLNGTRVTVDTPVPGAP
jgi:hypothetical protein